MRKKIDAIILASLQDTNEDRDEQYEISHDMILFGEAGILDSIDLVNLTIAIEERLEDELNISVTLANEKAFSSNKSPFLNIESLCDFILTLLNEERLNEGLKK